MIHNFSKLAFQTPDHQSVSFVNHFTKSTENAVISASKTYHHFINTNDKPATLPNLDYK